MNEYGDDDDDDIKSKPQLNFVRIRVCIKVSYIQYSWVM